MIPWHRLKILPVLVFVAALSFSVRMSEFVAGFSAAPGSAFAESPPTEPLKAPSEEEKPAEEAAKDTAKAEEKPAEAVKEEAKADSAPGADTPPAAEDKATDKAAEAPDKPASPAADGKKADWKDSLDSDLEYSEVKMELFEDLATRRKDLEEREREMVLREALLKAAEQEINQKYKELESLKTEIQGLLEQQNEEEKKRITSLVKIYEGMKAKDAARIFDTLDMDILIMVMSQMSERKSAPIIAAMNPDRARSVTIMLAEQKKIPTLAEPLIPQN